MIDMQTDIKTLYTGKSLAVTLAIGAASGCLAYLNHGILAFAIAMPFLVLGYYFVEIIFEQKHGLERRPPFGNLPVLDDPKARFLQTLLVTVFWSAFMFLMVWHNDPAALFVGTLIFGTFMFLTAGWRSRSASIE